MFLLSLAGFGCNLQNPNLEIQQGVVSSSINSLLLMTSNTARPTNIHPNKLNFIEGVDLIFNGWTALNLAVQMEFAGDDTQEKARWLRKVIVDHFDAGNE